MRKKKPTHGGKRIGAGRKAPDGVRKAYSVKLNDTEIAKIREKFNGLTEAVRSLL